MTVLDVGCGTGAITRGIAEAVAPGGRAIGLDANEDLIEEARRLHADVPVYKNRTRLALFTLNKEGKIAAVPSQDE